MSTGEKIRIGGGAFFLLFLLLLSQAGSLEPPSRNLQVVLRDSRQVIWERGLALEDRFCLAHRNSIYGATVWEVFRVDVKGSIWLCRLKTDSPAVLEYYGLEQDSSDWIDLSREIGSIPLLVTSLGKTHLTWKQESLALSETVPDGTFVEIGTKAFLDREGRR
jgi:hypothetical protein